MYNLLSIIKKPLRFKQYISIRFFSKKINKLQEIEIFFDNKKGLEIGGPSKIFKASGFIPLYPIVNTIDGVNFSNKTVWENTITEGNTYDFGNAKPGKQFIMDGTDLSKIESETYDFLLSSHSLEHIANPLKALQEWLRVLKKGGVLLLILPDSRYTFDRKRTPTKFEHLLQDLENNTSEKDLTHLEEIVFLHDLSSDDGISTKKDFRERSLNNFENRCLHHHVFDFNLLEQIFKFLNKKIILKTEAPPFHLIIMAVK